MNDQQIDGLIEKMVDLSEGLRDLRMDARAEGLHVMALNFLINARTEFPHDKGNEVLREVLRYAQACGTNLELGDSNVENTQSNSQTEATQNPPADEDSEDQPLQPNSRPDHGKKLRLLKELFLGAMIAVVLLWLLRY